MRVSDYEIALVRTPEEFERVRPRFEAASILGFDLETESLDKFHTSKEVWGMPMACPPAGGLKGLAVYIATEDDPDVTLDFDTHIAPWLEDKIFADDSKEFVGHNLKYDFKVCRTRGIRRLPKRIFDTMIASWMLTNDQKRHALDVVAYRFLRLRIQKDLMDIRDQYRKKDPKLYWIEMLRYGAFDGITPIKLRAKMIPALIDEGLAKCAKELEFPFVHVMTELEMGGLHIDVRHMGKLGNRITRDLRQLEKDIHAIVGYEFHIGSDVQLADALFDNPKGLGLLPHSWMERGKPRGTKNIKPGAWPTGEEILKAYDHPIMEKMLHYRAKAKLKNTYVLPFIELAMQHPERKVWTVWHQPGTSTGRLSSGGKPRKRKGHPDPKKLFNAQNFPKAKGTIRKGVVAPPKFLMLSCDYSQIELRLMAHQSGDPMMVDAYMKGLDLHRRTASGIADYPRTVPEDQVTADQRSLAKPVNFGFLYGMSAKRFVGYAWVDYGMRFTVQQAEAFRAGYFRLYEGVVGYHDYMRDFVRTNGYAENIIGERRYLPHHLGLVGPTGLPLPPLYDPDEHDERQRYLKWQAWSEGVNYTIQGSAAAMMKIAMLNVNRKLIRPYGQRVSKRYGRILTLWNSDASLANEVRLFGQVHDELQWYVREEIAEPFAKWLKAEMEVAVTLNVPVVAEYKLGKNAEECK